MSDEIEIEIGGAVYRTRPTAKYAKRKSFVPPDPLKIVAAVPGRITEVLVLPGRAVARGDGLLVLEAMKMQNRVTATAAGTVAEVHVEPGALVSKGERLVTMAP